MCGGTIDIVPGEADDGVVCVVALKGLGIERGYRWLRARSFAVRASKHLYVNETIILISC
jgi:hypothetical protein